MPMPARSVMNSSAAATAPPIPGFDETVPHSYSDTVKNITVAVDDETYRGARIAAAEADTSVSAMVRRFLQEIAARRRQPLSPVPDVEFERLRQQELDLRKELRGFSGADRLSRDDLYDRSRR